MIRGFEIKCLECGSENVSIQEEIDYDYDETPYTFDVYLMCNDCGNTSER